MSSMNKTLSFSRRSSGSLRTGLYATLCIPSITTKRMSLILLSKTIVRTTNQSPKTILSLRTKFKTLQPHIISNKNKTSSPVRKMSSRIKTLGRWGLETTLKGHHYNMVLKFSNLTKLLNFRIWVKNIIIWRYKLNNLSNPELHIQKDLKPIIGCSNRIIESTDLARVQSQILISPKFAIKIFSFYWFGMIARYRNCLVF